MLAGPFEWVMVAATTVGFATLALGLPVWIGRADPKLGRACVWTMALGLGIALGLQAITHVSRPVVSSPLLPAPPLGSFPSGHALLLAIALAVTAAHRRMVALALLPLAALVLWSRVELGHHHITDVVGGTALGAGLGWAAAGLAHAPRSDPWRWRWLLWPQVGAVFAISLLAYTGAFSGGRVPWLTLPCMDKALHFSMFGALAFGTHFATRGRRWRGIPWAVALPLSFALAEELLQATSPHRTADILDIAADLLGMVVFWKLAARMAGREEATAIGV